METCCKEGISFYSIRLFVETPDDKQQERIDVTVYIIQPIPLTSSIETLRYQ